MANEQDFFAWVQDQAKALRAQQAGALDWENLLEEIERMGRGERNALERTGKKPPDCLESVLVHEMTHLLEPSHNCFKVLIDHFMPD
ncbi:MAG: DUF29 family protein [Acidithiobacillus ferrivorans]